MTNKSPYVLNIDEEGYPILDNGIRADDSEFLEIVFQNMRRYQGDDKQVLCTRMQNKEVLITSFDDPLVAQDVLVAGSELRWNFLGGLSLSVSSDALRVDEWNRLHTYVGPEKIPAVMSRAAQAAFLLKHPHLESIAPLPFRSADADMDWNDRYQKDDIPWDMGAPNPVFLAHSERMLRESGVKWFIPGAGTGHEIPFLEKNAKNVTALDLSEIARDTFQKLYPTSRCDYRKGDFFNDKLGVFDAIVENCFFIALNPKLRAQVVKRMVELLSPKGFWGGSFFTRIAAGGPPFGLSEWELRAHIEPYFEILEWQRSPHSHPRRQWMELWVLLRKR